MSVRASFAVALAAIVGATIGSLGGCDRARDHGSALTSPGGDGPTSLFVDRSATSGVDFVHDPAVTPKKQLVEINSGGVSLLDYDGDGDLDLFFPQGAPLPGSKTDADWRDRLYRNDGGFHFTDVTEATKAFDRQYTYSAACPDVDGDGDPDLYLCNAGRNTWLRNDVKQGGTFVDVTNEVGAAFDAWSTAAAFVDFDRDGDLDLYVATYVEQRIDHPGCGYLQRGEQWRIYCHPDEFPPQDDRLFRNDGGRFVDVSESCGLRGKGGAGLGAVATDYDGDGDVDLFVANDSNPCFLWRNDGAPRGPIQLTEVAAEAWVAVNGTGLSTAAMGVDAGDVDGDGDFDLAIGNLAMESNTLFVNDGRGRFDDRSALSGFGPPSRLDVGFGCELFDADLDGDLDAMLANGHIMDNVELYEPTQTFRQPPRFYENLGAGRFREIGARLGGYFATRQVGRGLAVGDLDDDGDLDVVVAHWDGRPALLENTTNGVGRAGRPWLGLRLLGRAPNRQAIGAAVTVESGGRTRRDEVRGTSSYAAFHDLRLVFALDDTAGDARVTIRWPDGSTSSHGPLAAGRYHSIEQPPP